MRTSYYFLTAAGLSAAAVLVWLALVGRSGAGEVSAVRPAAAKSREPAPYGAAEVTLPPIVLPPDAPPIPPVPPVPRPPVPAPAAPPLPVPPVPAPPLPQPPALPPAPAPPVVTALPGPAAVPSPQPAPPPVAPPVSSPVTPPVVPLSPVVTGGPSPAPPVVAAPSVGTVKPEPAATLPPAPPPVVTAPPGPAAVPSPQPAPPVASPDVSAAPVVPPVPLPPAFASDRLPPPSPEPPSPAAPPSASSPQPAPPPQSVASPAAPTDPVPLHPPRPLAAAPPAGQFVVLKGDALLRGTVTIRDDRVVVRQGSLDRSFPRSEVLFVGDTADEVYRFMLGRVETTDVPARLGVARWCLFAGLREQALAEAREVLKLQPQNRTAAEMVRSLEESLRRYPAGGPDAAPTTRSVTLTTEVPEPEVDPEAAATFASRAQPVLANRCMECHARPDHPGPFKLIRVTGWEIGPQSTRANLRATVAQVKKNDPANSPLLLKGLTAHGGMSEPAFLSRQAPAYKALEAWVHLAARPTVVPVVPPTPSAGATPPPAPPPRPVPPAGSPPALPLVEAPTPPPLPAPDGPAGPKTAPPGAPASAPGNAAGGDEFDPEVFNRSGR